MSRRSEATKQRILDAAEELFAKGGAWRTPLSDVVRVAGQRNRSAIHYHFGSREELIFAVLERGRAPEIAERTRMLDALPTSTTSDVRALVEILVRPSFLTLRTQRGRRVRMITADVALELTEAQLADARPADVARVFDLLVEALPPMPAAVRRSRMGWALRLLIETMADRARELESGARPLLSAKAFRQNLVEILVALLVAPLPAE